MIALPWASHPHPGCRSLRRRHPEGQRHPSPRCYPPHSWSRDRRRRHDCSHSPQHHHPHQEVSDLLHLLRQPAWCPHPGLWSVIIAFCIFWLVVWHFRSSKVSALRPRPTTFLASSSFPASPPPLAVSPRLTLPSILTPTVFSMFPLR